MIATGLVAMIGVNLWSVNRMWGAKAQVHEAVEELEEARRDLANLRRLEVQPRVASLEEETESPSDIAERILNAFRQAGLPETTRYDSPVSASNTVSDQFRDSDYVERETLINIYELRLPQIVQFAQFLEEPEKGLTVRDVTLTAGTSTAPGNETWNANLTLTQLIFSPKSNP